jgi:hypothetical protein
MVGKGACGRSGGDAVSYDRMHGGAATVFTQLLLFLGSTLLLLGKELQWKIGKRP